MELQRFLFSHISTDLNHTSYIHQRKYFFNDYSPTLPTHLCRSTSPGETKLLASEIYEILQAAGQEEAEQAEAAAASCKRKAHFFLGSNNKRAKTVVLHIDGLDDPVSICSATPNYCEDLILGRRACCCR